MANLPYAQNTGTLEKMLDRITNASVPDTFSQDFVSTKLSMPGGTPKSIIPFVKKMGFVASDGTPTERYKEFRNPEKAGFAIADSMRDVYSLLFEMNEYVYDLDNTKLRNLIVEVTGAEAESTPVEKTVSTFSALKKLAKFEGSRAKDSAPESIDHTEELNAAVSIPISSSNQSRGSEQINLSYTINLNLHPTTDIEVFNAIFKSLKHHLLED